MPPLSSTERAVQTASNSFSMTLFNQVAAQRRDENFFISPLSVSMALAMILNGAAGQTYTEMQKTLGLSGLSNAEINQSFRNLIAMFSSLDPNVTFRIANSIWYRNTFSVSRDFIYTDSTYFDAQVTPLDFSSSDAAGTINSWVDKATNGKIPSIVNPPIPPTEVMYIINALYFHGAWRHEFSYKATKLGTFHLADGGTETDSMMTINDTLSYYSDPYFTAVGIPYGDGDYSMLALLPTSTSPTQPIPQLTQTEFNSILSGLSLNDITVTMPRFTMSYSTDLDSVLSNMGMADAFGAGADFTGINPGGGLFISSVKHKAYINVNEEGTEAAAVTSIGVGATVVTRQLTVDLNRPFIFLIKENQDNTIMFMGVLADPGASS